MESYLVKADRGRANRDGATFDMSYWVERNFCAEEDRSILRLEPRSASLRAALRADPVLGPLHDAAVAWRRDRFRKLMEEETFRGLMGRLMLAPPSVPLAAEDQRILLRHAVPRGDTREAETEVSKPSD